VTAFFLAFVLTSANVSAALLEESQRLVQSRLAIEYPSLNELYVHLHTHPELSFQEVQTSKRIGDELARLGFEVAREFGLHGVVGLLRNGAGPTVLIRTDLDALPVEEATGLPYASRVKAKDDKGNEVGVMHACGHDVHMTVFVGTARLLSHLKDQWHGTLVMVGQPAEERVGGARAMLGAGLYQRFPKPDYALALHVHAGLPAGTVGCGEGYVLANVDSVDITIRGQGGHGAWPHTTKDPIVLAAQTVLALQTIVSRETEPIEPAVITVGSIHGGTKRNIIPDEVRLQLTVRSYSGLVRSNTLAAIRRITRGLGQAAGLAEDRFPLITLDDESSPSTYNDPELARRLASTFRTWLGEDKTVKTRPVMGAEDFGEFGRTPEKVPICIFWLGSVDPALIAESESNKQPLPSLHSSLYQPLPEPTITTGVRAMTAAVLNLMQTHR
jgi:hippurate hydrolase